MSQSKYLARWRMRSAPRTLELSGGYSVEIRPVEIANLMFSGEIPLTLMREARDIKQGGDGEYDPEDMMRMLPLIDAVVLAAVTDPPLSRDGAGDTLPLSDIPFADRVLIFQEVNRPATELAPFRPEPDAGEAAAPGGEDLRGAAE